MGHKCLKKVACSQYICANVQLELYMTITVILHKAKVMNISGYFIHIFGLIFCLKLNQSLSLKVIIKQSKNFLIKPISISSQ